MPDRELDLTALMETRDGWNHQLKQEAQGASVVHAIDLASNQGTTTWLTRDGKRVAKIAPAREVPESRLTASAFTALSAEERRAAALERFYGDLRGPLGDSDSEGVS